MCGGAAATGRSSSGGSGTAARAGRRRLALQGEQARPPRQVVVVAAGAGVLALVQQLQVAGIDGLGLVRVGPHQVTMTDVVGPRRAAVGLARERVALTGGLRSPRT